MRRAAIAITLAFVALFAAAGLAQASSYPNRPIRMIVGFPPRGVVDVAARIIGDRLGTLLGQQVFVDRADATTYARIIRDTGIHIER